MGIISRFAEIMESNINALLDKCEDPSKMIDQTLRELNEELAQVKKETASIMAEEVAAKRRVSELQTEINKYDAAARKALQAGNEEDATRLIGKKQSLVNQKITADQTYAIAKANADKMKQMYNKLNTDIQTLNGRRTNVKAQVAMANAQNRVNKMTDTMDKNNASDTFARMEAKAQKMLDEATAKAELSMSALDDEEALVNKYAAGTDVSVNDELLAMKTEMGLL